MKIHESEPGPRTTLTKWDLVFGPPRVNLRRLLKTRTNWWRSALSNVQWIDDLEHEDSEKRLDALMQIRDLPMDREFAMSKLHLLKLVETTSSMACRIREHLHMSMPGYCNFFSRLLEHKSAMAIARHCESPAKVLRKWFRFGLRRRSRLPHRLQYYGRHRNANGFGTADVAHLSICRRRCGGATIA